MKRYVVAAAVVLFGAQSLRAAEPARELVAEILEKQELGLTVIGLRSDLPPGRWEVAATEPRGALEQAHVLALDGPRVDRDGREPSSRRLRLHQERQRTDSGRYKVQEYGTLYRRYATEHGGVGPATFAEILQPQRPDRGAERAPEWEQSPWWEDQKNKVPGPFFFLVPNVAVSKEEAQSPWPLPTSGGTPVVLELRPYVDDGMHWVAFSNGRVARVPVDQSLLERHGLTLSFFKPRGADEPQAPAPVPHAVLALLRDRSAGAVAVTLREAASGRTIELRTRADRATRARPELLGEWAAARASTWWPWAGGSSIAAAWLARTEPLYGRQPARGFDAGPWREPRRSTDVFSVLGGRAALRETLQLEALRGGGPGTREEAATLPVGSLKGVEVASHPFGEMLGDSPGGRLPLAERVLPDRLFAHFAKPAALFPFLEDGGDFLFRAGSLFTRSWVDDGLEARYLGRLGLDGKLGRKFLESGEVLEAAVVAADLFFIDGTDLVVLLRVKDPGKLPKRLKDLGVPAPTPGAIAERRAPGGGTAYWAIDGDLLAVSTSRAELEAVLALGASGGAGSLGRSAEFRYMLTKLAPGKQTRAYLYFSDPFIRRMIGPAVKIGQLRRLRARAGMEAATAGALLRLLDGGKGAPDLEQLARLGYVPASAPREFRLREDFGAESPVWGPARSMAGLGAAPVETVTPSEGEAYRNFVEQYSRYWRQYFDPVALRLDDAPGGDLELEAFILPLLESQVYDQVRALLRNAGTDAPLRVPAVTPEPVLLLSLNLNEEAWVKVAGGMGDLFTRYLRLDPAFLDLLGPALHFAVQDGDPIVALGNADILGGFSGPAFDRGLRNQGIPMMLAMLTRPCKLIVEVQDERAALGLLRRAAAWQQPAQRDEMDSRFRRVAGRDAWIWSLSFAGVVKLRFGIEVQNGYLVVSNLPWSQPVAVGRGESQPLNGGALRIAPGAVRLGLPGLFATEGEQGQEAALRGMGALYPLLLTVSSSPEQAAARHAALFGWRPLHPGAGAWSWKDGVLASSVYGTVGAWEQPPWRQDLGDFGLFQGVDRLAVAMQLEEGGLRARTRWSWRGK